MYVYTSILKLSIIYLIVRNFRWKQCRLEIINYFKVRNLKNKQLDINNKKQDIFGENNENEDDL